MGSLASSLRKANYLQDAGTAFKSILHQNEVDRDQESFNQMLGKAVEGIRNNLGVTTEPSESDKAGLPSTSRLSEFVPGNGLGQLDNQTPPEASGLQGIYPSIAGNGSIPGMVNNAPPDVRSLNDLANVRLGQKPDRYAEMGPIAQRKKNLGLIADVLTKSMGLKNLDPNKLNQALQALQLTSDASQTDIPTLKTTAEDPTKRIVQTDQYGKRNVIAEGSPDPKDEETKRHNLAMEGANTNADRLKETKRHDLAMEGYKAAEEKRLSSKEQSDPSVILEAGKNTIAEIDKKLAETNQVLDPAGYNALQNTRVKEISKINVAKAKINKIIPTTYADDLKYLTTVKKMPRDKAIELIKQKRGLQ